ncbi:MAG: hypothetical protein AAFY98_03090 [Verrucomicrobiota bacterium]
MASKKNPQKRLWLPGALEWELWQFSQKGEASRQESLETLPEQINGCGLVMPARYLSCLSFLAPTHEKALVEEMTPLIVEKTGMLVEDAEDIKRLRIDILEKVGEQSLVRVMGLTTTLPDQYSTYLVDFCCSWLDVILPKVDGFYLWSERGVWVLGISQASQWIYLQPLTAKSVGTVLAQELRLIWMRLSSEKVYRGPTRITVWLAEGEDASAFQQMNGQLKWMLETLPRPDPQWPKPVEALMPSAVQQLKKSAAQKKQLVTFGFAFLVVCLFVFVGLGGHLFYVSQQNSELQAKQEADAVEVEAIQAAAEFWSRMEPALELDFSPLEILKEINSNLPNEGVRIIRFDHDPYEFRLEGEARNVQIAVAFTEKLRRVEKFSGMDWSTPSPNNLPGGLASFSIRAMRPGAPEDEG